MVCERIPARCMVFWMSMASSTVLRSTRALTRARWRIASRTMSCLSSARICVSRPDAPDSTRSLKSRRRTPRRVPPRPELACRDFFPAERGTHFRRDRVIESVKALLVMTGIALISATAGAEEAAPQSYKNLALSPQERAADLVHRMTLEEKASQLVNQSRAIPRLGVPAYDWWSEALHGVAVSGTTEFPEPVGLAATFDVPGIHDMATAIGIEGRIKHAQAERAGHSNIFEGLDFWAP